MAVINSIRAAGISKSMPRKTRSSRSPNQLWLGAEIQKLECRQMLSAVSWTGAAADNNWSSSANWSSGTVPSSTSDVTIDAPAGTTIHGPTIDTAINSLTITSANLLLDGADLSVATNVDVEGNQSLSVNSGTLTAATITLNNSTLTLSGGTIANAAVTETGTGEVVASTSGGSLSGVTLNGNLDATNGNLTVTNNLVLNGTLSIGSADGSTIGYVDFGDGTAAPATLSGNATVLLGASTSNTLSNYSSGSGAAGTLTFASTVTVHGQSGNLVSPFGGTIINNGTISADSPDGTISFGDSQSNVENQGTLSAINGGTLNIQGLTGNVGTLIESSTSSLSFDGSLVTAATSPAQFDPEGTVTFAGSGTSTDPQLLEAASQDFGATWNAYQNNSAFGTLALENGTYVKLVDNVRNTASSSPEAVYADTVTVPVGTTLDLNGLHLYARVSTIQGSVINGTIIQTPDTSLSNATVADQSPIGTLVGTFSSVESGSNNTFSYQLVGGNVDNDSFAIDASGNLTTTQPLNFTVQNSYTILVQTTDENNVSFTQAFTISVLNVPTGIALSNSTVPEHSPVGTIVGSFSSVEAGTNNTFTYSLVPGVGSTDNDSFAIDANGNLTTNDILDFATQSSYSIRVSTTDENNNTFDQVFTISLQPAHAPRVLTVDTLADTPQDGFTTLREAIATANSDAPGDTIVFANGLSGTIVLSQGDIAITNSMTITGPSAASLSISGGNSSRIFTIDDGNPAVTDQVTISRVTLTQGDGVSSDSSGDGGAVFNSEDLFLSDDTFAGNSAALAGGGLYNSAGSVFSTNDTFTGNSAENGGGLFDYFGAVTSVHDTVAGNSATGDGGGIAIEGSGPSGSWNVLNTIVAGNTSNSGIPSDVENEGGTIIAGQTLIGDANSSGGLMNNVNGNLVGWATNTIFVTDSNGTPLLANNGGTTQTIALAPGSPAIGAGGALVILAAPVGAATTGATTILTVNDSNSIAVGDLLRIDAEIVQVTGVSGSNVTVLRGQAGTTASSHTSNTALTLAYDQRGIAHEINDLGAVESIYPVDISLSNTVLTDQSPAGSVVGTFSTTEPGAGSSFTYSLVGGTPDNADFRIDTNGKLITTQPIDLAAQPTYSIQVQTTDQNNQSFDKTFNLSVTAAPTGTVDSWLNDISGGWSVPSNWSTGQIPQSGNDVHIGFSDITVTYSSGTVGLNSLTSTAALVLSGGTLPLQNNSTVSGAFTLSGGTLTGAGSLTITGQTTWTGGTMSGNGVTDAQGGLILGQTGQANELSLDTRTLTNEGAATFLGDQNGSFSQLNTANGATINNWAGGTWDIQDDNSIFNSSGALSTFNNAGMLTKSAGSGTSTIGIKFNNTGSVDVQSGTLAFTEGDKGNTTGAFASAEGATLEFGGSMFTLSSGSSVTGSTVEFAAGTANIGGTYSVAGSTLVSGGTVNFTSPTVTSLGTMVLSAGTANLSTGHSDTLTTLTQSGGILTGSDTVTVNGTTTWTGGEMSGSGTTSATGGLTFGTAIGTVVLDGARLLTEGAFASGSNVTVDVTKYQTQAQEMPTVNNQEAAFLDTWLMNGGEGGVLKAPTDMAQPGTGGVWSQRFEGGILYYSEPTGMLVVPFHLPAGTSSLFSPSYDTVRANLLSQFFYNGFIAERVVPDPNHPNQANITFADQTYQMGEALLQFSQEATILQHAGFNPTASENVIQIILRAFGQLDTEAVSVLYGPQYVQPGFFLRDYVSNGGVIDGIDYSCQRQGIPSGWTVVTSDFRTAWVLKANKTQPYTGDAGAFTDPIFSADQVTALMVGWWGVTHYSTDANNIALAKSEATQVMNYLISIGYELPPLVLPDGTAIAVTRGQNFIQESGYLSEMADAVLGLGNHYLLDPNNVIPLFDITKDEIVNALTNIVVGVFDACGGALIDAWSNLTGNTVQSYVSKLISDNLQINQSTQVSLQVAVFQEIAEPIVTSYLAEQVYTGPLTLAALLPPDVVAALNAVNIPIPSGFTPGGASVTYKTILGKKIPDGVVVTPPSITFKTFNLGELATGSYGTILTQGQFESVTGLVEDLVGAVAAVAEAGVAYRSNTQEVQGAGEFGFTTNVGNVWAAASKAFEKVQHLPILTATERHLSLMQFAFDPDPRMDDIFNDLALANITPSLAVPTPDLFAALLRPEVLGVLPNSDVESAVASMEATEPSEAPNTGLGSQYVGWLTKNRWETGSQAENDPTTNDFNGLDLLTLETLSRSIGLKPTVFGNQPAVSLAADPSNSALTDLSVVGTDQADHIQLIAQAGGGVVVAVNGTSYGPYYPTGEITVAGGGGDDQVLLDGNTGVPTRIVEGSGDNTVVLQGGAGPQVSIEGGTGSNTLQSDNGDGVTWTISGTGSGSLSTGAVFSSMTNLQGGNDGDTFVFDSGGSIAGNVNARGGSLDFANAATTQNITLTGFGSVAGFDGTAATATIGGSFSNVGSIWAGYLIARNTLTGVDSDATWTITSGTSQYTVGGNHELNLSGFGVLDGGAGVQTFDVQGTGYPLKLFANGGNNVFDVGSNAGIDDTGYLGEIGGPLSIDAGSGNANQLTISNMGGGNGSDVIVTSSSITGFGPETITYTATGGAFNGGSAGILLIGSILGGDVFNVQSTLAGSQTTIQTSGTTTVNVSSLAPASGRLNSIAGMLTVTGDGNGQLNVDDRGNTTDTTGTLTATTLNGLDLPAGIAYSGLSTFNIDLGPGQNKFNVQSTSAATTVSAGAGNTIFNVGSLMPVSGGIVDGIVGLLSLFGNIGRDILNIDDSGSAGARPVRLPPRH